VNAPTRPFALGSGIGRAADAEPVDAKYTAGIGPSDQPCRTERRRSGAVSALRLTAGLKFGLRTADDPSRRRQDGAAWLRVQHRLRAFRLAAALTLI
jgi:hypothetical protein